MACFNSCRPNWQGPYYPCPVCTCTCSCSSNTVSNPVTGISLAFFALTETVTVANNALIPVALVTNSGTDITSIETGEAILVAGTYQATYNVTSVLGADGINSFGLTLNGVTIAYSVSTATGTIGSIATVSNTLTVTVSSPGVLRLVNLNDDSVNVNLANLTITKVD